MNQFGRHRESDCDPSELGPSVMFHLLGTVDYDDCVRLQHRLLEETLLRDDGRIAVLLCEHWPVITVGRSGSRRDIRLTSDELRRRTLEVRWASRSGGCVLHAPGQLAIHAIVPLRWHGWTVSDYKQRLGHGIAAALAEMKIVVHREAAHSLSARSGELAHIGVGVRDGVAHHGAFLNVSPDMADFAHVDVVERVGTVPSHRSFIGLDEISTGGTRGRTMSSLLTEHRQPVRMAGVRAAITEHLAAAFGTSNYHLTTGHPLLRRSRSSGKQSA